MAIINHIKQFSIENIIIHLVLTLKLKKQNREH